MPRNESFGATVLIVEDDARYAAALRRTLEMQGMHVEIAHNGEVARNLIVGRERFFDAVLLDQELGDGKTGVEVLRELKKQSGLVAEVIFLTGHGNRELGVDAIRAGAFRYFTKQSENDDEIVCAIAVAQELALLRRATSGFRESVPKVTGYLWAILLVSIVALTIVVVLNIFAPSNFFVSVVAVISLIVVLLFAASGVNKFKLIWKDFGKNGSLEATGTATSDHRDG